MVQSRNIKGHKIAPVENPVFTGLNNHSKVSTRTVDRGSFRILSPLDYIEAIQEGGNQQSNLFLASAGNDLRMSTMRPNPYLSAEIEMRGSKNLGAFLCSITRLN
jgi:hypothetical protein